MDLIQLQNLCKRDPDSYRDEFLLQYRHYQTEMEIFKLKPSKDPEAFAALINYLSQVAACYPQQLAEFPNQLMELLENNYSVLDPELRRALVKALILMRNKDLLPPTSLLRLFFMLFRCHDKALRSLLYTHIVSDIKNLNQKQKNHKNFMYTMLADTNEVAAKKSVDVMIELYRKRIWNDSKTVNVISEAVFSPNAKIKTCALKFFLTVDAPDDEDEDAAAKETLTEKEAREKYSTRAGKTKKRKRRLEKALKKARKQTNAEREVQPNFPALELVNNPQGYTEKLLGCLKHSNDKFEVKIMMMNLISRLMSSHKLMVLNFYSHVLKYVKPHQEHITLILAIAAQSCHDLIPPDALEPLLNTLTNNFASEHCAPEVIAIGINTIREICARQPCAMTKQMLRELTVFKKSHDKGVMMAARSLITLYRNVNPMLLHKKDRGKFADLTIVPKEYGELRPVQMELLGQSNDGETERAKGTNEEPISWFIDEKKGGVPISLATGGQSSGGEGEEEEEEDEDEDEEEEGEEGEGEEEEEEEGANVASTEENSERASHINRKRRKVQEEESEESEEDDGGPETGIGTLVDPGRIEGYRKRQRMAKEERMAMVLEGREGREKFGRPIKTGAGGTTNKEKEKNQPFMMARQKKAIQDKRKLSVREKARKRRGKGKGQRKQFGGRKRR
ncbi:hypothetical protein QOT17_019758 [Balamuthia mandrillaris]